MRRWLLTITVSFLGLVVALAIAFLAIDFSPDQKRIERVLPDNHFPR